MRLLNIGVRSESQRERGLAVFILLLLMVLGWFSVALASNLDSPRTVRFVDFPIQIDSIADYSVDSAGIKIPVIELGLIAEMVSSETLAAIQKELLEPVPVEPDLSGIYPVVKLSIKAAERSIPEPGRLVVYNLILTNHSSKQITLDALVDSQFGNLGRRGCPLRVVIAGYATYSCSFSGLVEGNAGNTVTNLVTASGSDDDGHIYTTQADSSVALSDTIPTPSISKSASKLSVNEPGSMVTITVQVTNTSQEPARLVSLWDDLRGDLNGVGNCNTSANPFPANLERGAIYTCSFPAEIVGNAGYMITASTMAKIQDDEGNLAFTSDNVTVGIADLKPSLNLKNTANKTTLNELSGSVIYSIAVTNTSVEPVILTSLDGSVFGNLNNKGSCSIGGFIQAGATYSCNFTETIIGNAGDIKISAVTATIEDDEGTSISDTASAAVEFINVDPTVMITNSVSPGTLNEPGGILTFTIQGKNTSVENVALLSLIDDQIGNLAGVGTCGTLSNPYPADLSPGNFYECQFSVPFSGDAGDSYNNIVTISIQDDEGSSASDSDRETVGITDVLPTISATNQAGVVTIDEPGGYVPYTVQVENTSPEPVTLTSLTDSRFGDLTARGCLLSSIPSDASYSCDYTGTVTGDAGDSFANTFTAEAGDNEGNSAVASQNETVAIGDVLPAIIVSNGAGAASEGEPGGNLTYTVEVENKSPESLTLTSLTDSQFGDLTARGCLLGTIAVGNTYSCDYSGTASGEAGDTFTNTTTAVVEDNEGNSGTDTEVTIVEITDVLPTITVSNQAGVSAVDEPGSDLTYTIQVENTSPETLFLTSLIDSQFGDLTAKGCGLGSINIGATYSCDFTGTASGDAGDNFVNTITATVEDNDGNSEAASADSGVAITDVLPSINLTIQAGLTTIAEPGGDLIYNLQVENTSPEPVTLTSLADSQFGDLTTRGCPLSSIASGGTYSCDFTGPVSGDSGETFTNTITAAARDNDGNSIAASAEEAISILDVLPSILVTNQAGVASVDEPGGDVTYTIQVQNTSPEELTLTALIDNIFGDLTVRGCLVGTIPLGATYSCDFTGAVNGDAGDVQTNTTTAAVWDNDGNSAVDSDYSTVNITDVLPIIGLEHQADLVSVNEPGGTVTYTLQVHNASPEPVSLSSLSSNLFGSLHGQGTCLLGGVIPDGGTYSCSYTRSVSGNGTDTHTNTVTANVKDNENNTGSASAAADVMINDLDPTITVNKTAGIEALKAPGGDVTFFVVVDNTSQEDVTLTSLVDDSYGDLNGQGFCTLPQEIIPGGSYSCSFSGVVNGISGEVHTNIVTALAIDDELNNVVASGTAEVTITDQDIPTINLTKTPFSAAIPEPGGMVTFTLQIDNTFNKDLELTSIIDDSYGDLNGLGTCSVPQTILIGGNYLCSFSGLISGNAGLIHTNNVIAKASESGATGSANDDAMVAVTDMQPGLIASITSSTLEVAAPGELVTFTVDIENISVENVTITNLSDNIFGDLHGLGSCAVNNSIDVGGTYSCIFEGFVSGNAGETHTNTLGVQIQDDEDNLVTASTTASVEIIPPTPVDISGQVRNDTDFDGNLADLDAGIPGVTLQLSNGICGLGSTCPSAITNIAGSYTFTGILPGDYVIIETDLAGYVSTADSQGANDNQIALTVISGINLDGNDFLDTNQTASIRGQVRDDRDGDGDFTDNDYGLAGLNIELLQGVCNLGLDCRRTTTDMNGSYEFTNVIAGEYIIVQYDLTDYISTADSDLPNDNRIRAAVIKGMDSTSNIFLDSTNPSSCIPLDPAAGFVISTNPAVGEVIPLSTSTIEVVFNQAMATSGGGSVLDRANYDDKIKNLTFGGDVNILAVNYYTPTKTATLVLNTSDPDWLPGSQYQLKVKGGIKNGCGTRQDIDVLVSFFTMSGISGQVRNDLDVDGDLGDNDQGIYGVTLELVQSGCSLGSCPTTTTDINGFFRFADLGAGNYTLHEYDLSGFTSTADADGGNDNLIDVTVGVHDFITSHDFLDTSSCSPPDPVDGFVSSISPADGSTLVSMSTNSITIQFNQPMYSMAGEGVLKIGNYHDKLKNLNLGGDVQITAVGYDVENYTATLTLGTSDSDWQPGSRYELIIDHSIENACKVSQGVDVISEFQTSSAISGQVREDEDGDGNLTDPDPGLAHVVIELSDGICSIGINCRKSLTSGSGFYIFADVAPGTYTLYEQNPAWHTSTADTSGANDDMISINLAPGPISSQNDFLDTDRPLFNVVITPEVSEIGEGSRGINYTVSLENVSAESATLISLSDDVFGNLNGQGSCAAGTLIPSCSTYTCSFAGTITGNAGDTHSNTLLATVQDASGNGASDSNSASVIFTDVNPSLSVSSTPDITEVDATGQLVTFSVQVDNTSPESVTLIKLDDNIYGNLDGQGNCSLQQTIPVGGTYSCTYSGVVSGNIGDVKINEILAEIQDDEGNITSEKYTTSINVVDILPTITVSKIPSPNTIDPPLDVSFDIVVTNTSHEAITLVSLVDDFYGNLNGMGSCDLSVLPVIPAFGGIYCCSFTETISGSDGESHTNIVTTQISDDEGNLVTEIASATVNIIDSLPSFNLSIVPDLPLLSEPGGDITYIITIENTSPEAITILSLIDDTYGDLSGDCSVGGSILVGDSYLCSFTRTISGVEGDIVTNYLTASIQDDEGNIVSKITSAAVTITEVLPSP